MTAPRLRRAAGPASSPEGEASGLEGERLTLRERQVLKLTAEGKSSKETAELLCISHRTVERHRANLLVKLNLRRTAELVRYAFLLGGNFLITGASGEGTNVTLTVPYKRPGSQTLAAAKTE